MKQVTIYSLKNSFLTDKTQIDYKSWGVEFVGACNGAEAKKYYIPWSAIEYIEEYLTSSARPLPSNLPVEESSLIP